MRYSPADWNTYTQKQRKEWHYKPYEEQREIVNQSYLSLIADENGNLDAIKILEIIMDLQDRVDELESTCSRIEVNYD
jgi:ubiquinone biosynthesis protein Coq4